jgi:parvulin-like peptidyl-prolyl isomerase
MMQTMRNSAKIIFFIVLVTFLGFMAWGGVATIFANKSKNHQAAPPGVIGVVDGIHLSNQMFDSSYRQRIQSLSKDDHEPTDTEMEKARTDIWNNMVSLALIEAEAQRHNIVVSDQEVAEYMRYAPPKDIIQSPEFATNGQFDIGKYQAWLQQLAVSPDPRALSILNDFETQIRQQLLISRVQDFVVSMVRISENDVKSDYIDKNEKVKVQYIFVPGGDYDSTITTVPEAEVKAKYDKDIEQFKQPEMAKLKYVQFPKTASENDIADAKKEIFDIYAMVTSGTNFDSAAVKYSQDPGSAPKGGDLGWFGEGRMVQEFYDATSKLAKIGDISAPFKSQFGWHIVKLTGKKMTKDKDGKEKPEYQASHILISTDASNETLAEIEKKANNFRIDAEKLGFKEAADEYALTIAETTPFPAGQSVPSIGQEKGLNDFAFREKIGEISELIPGRNAFFVCQISSRTPAGYTPFADAKERVQRTLLREKRVELAHKRGEELVSKLTSSGSFENLAALSGKTIQETDFFSRTQFIPKIGNDADFIGASFALTMQNPISKCVNAKTGAYIIKLLDRQVADLTGYATAADSLMSAELEAKQKDIWTKWLNAQRQNVKIEDYRAMYYGS